VNPVEPETSLTSNFSIARQHIVDTDKSIVGYELFNRTQGARDHTLASDVSLVLNVMAQSGTKLINGQADLFINATHESLTGSHWDFLVPQRTIIEVPPFPGHDAAGIEEARLKMLTLRKRGFRLAFTHTVVAPVYKSWQGIADFVKVDVNAVDPAKLKPLVDAIHARTGAIAVAEKVESAAQFEVFKDIGFHFFQGYWFSRPELLSTQVISPSQMSAANLFLAALLNRAVPMASGAPVTPGDGVRRQVNRAAAAKLFSRSIGRVLLMAGAIAQGIHDWVLTLSRCWTRHIPGRSQPRNPAHTKPHPSQSYKRAA
jgi:EAL and modified HD-GYP domain-containing signal transduction protein